MKKKVSVVIITILFVLYLSGCNPEKKQDPITKTELFMGTVIKITLYDNINDNVMNKAFNKLKEIDNIVSINKNGTEIDKVNENAGLKAVKVSDTSFDIISKGLEYSRLSNGDYDITVGPLVKLWSIGLPEAKVPSESEINESIKSIDYNKVKLNNETKEVYLEEKGMKLDLGSIAKGYAADEVTEVLKEEGIQKAIIDLGGNIFAMGSKEKDKGWNIGIQDPFSNRGAALGTIKVSNKTIVTTGTYERYIEDNGTKYHHILSPKTGYPYDTNIAGVSIVTNKSIDADALSTLIFTKGLEEGYKLIEDRKDVEAIFVTNDKKIYTTSGLKNNFELLESDFKISNIKS